MTTGFTGLLLTGIAEYLAAQGIGTWSPGTAYAATDVGIVIGDPQQQPDRQIAIRSYDITDIAGLDDVTVRVQLRFRGQVADPDGPDELADAVHDVLHNLTRALLPNGVRVAQALRTIATPLDPDTTGRYQRADSYAVDTYHRSALLTD